MRLKKKIRRKCSCLFENDSRRTLCDYWQDRVFLIWVNMEIHRVYVCRYW